MAFVAALFLIFTIRWWASARSDADTLLEQHLTFQVAHPGWSFPARFVLADGTEVAWAFGPDAEWRVHLPIERTPRHLIDAVTAAEDRNFHDHFGVDLIGLARATRANVAAGGAAQGGSTLTMQLVRNLTGRTERTLTRKLDEIGLAVAVHRAIGERGVLQAYLDAPYLGQWGSLSVCGFEAASRFYFGTSAADLDLAQAATLAAILPTPGRLAPDRHPEAARAARDRVLRAMAEEFGYDVSEALAAPITVVPPAPLPDRYPTFVSAAHALLLEQLPEPVVHGAGLEVRLTVDPELQAITDRVMPKRLDELTSMIGTRGGPLQAATVLVDLETGTIRAMYAGRDPTSTGFNRATQARRQPGSSFKPVVWTHALGLRDASGAPRFTQASAVPNSPKQFDTPTGPWRPRNPLSEYSTTAAMVFAAARSFNVATANLLEASGGPPELIKTAARLGFDTSSMPEELGIALGQAEVTPREMARFAAVIGRMGTWTDAMPFDQVLDASGAARWVPTPAAQTVDPTTAALVRDLMYTATARGTGGGARGAGSHPGYGGPLAGKTGTTDGERDAWFVGITPGQAAVVWLGHDEPAKLGWGASDLAAPLWGWWMHELFPTAHTTRAFPPDGLHRGWICGVTGHLANTTCDGFQAAFAPGTQPTRGCPLAHAPPEPGVDAAGNPTLGGRRVHQSLWDAQREAAERRAAEAAAIVD